MAKKKVTIVNGASRRGLLILLLVFLFAGCASFSKNRLPEVKTLPPPTSGTSKPVVSFSFSSYVDNILWGQETNRNFESRLREEFFSVLNDSGWFSHIVAGVYQGDIHIDLQVIKTDNPAALLPAAVTAFSLYIIPSWETNYYIIKAKVRANNEVCAYKLDDAMVTVRWLPLLVSLPLKHGSCVAREIRKNMWKNLICAMKEDGLLGSGRP